MGGGHSPENISLLCPAHNRFLAELDYGQAATKVRAAVKGKVAVKERQTSHEETSRAPASA
jgi:hypothetical protein